MGLYSVKPIYRKPKYATRRGVQKERTKEQNIVVLVGGASGENGHVVFIEVSLHWVAISQQESHQALPKYNA